MSHGFWDVVYFICTISTLNIFYAFATLYLSKDFRQVYLYICFEFLIVALDAICVCEKYSGFSDKQYNKC